MQSSAACNSVLQCVVVYCSVFRCVAVRHSRNKDAQRPQCVTVSDSALAVCCGVFQCVAVCCIRIKDAQPIPGSR